MSSGEIAIFLSNVFILLGCLVENLHIAGEIPLSVHFAESIHGFIRNICADEFVITCPD